jgi:hypothetical protein
VSYMVSAQTTVSGLGGVSFRRDSPVEALTKAMELLAEGMQDVRITDEQGRSYSPSDFDKFFVAERR